MVFAVNAQFLITTECMTVTSAMRKSSRWVNAGIAAILGAPSDTGSENALLSTLNTQESAFPEKDRSGDSSGSGNSASKVLDDDASAAALELSSPETALILGFATVRPEITANKQGDFSSVAVVRPFLEVVKSPLVSGHITSLALTSIEKFFVLEVLNQNSRDIRDCLNETIHALTHCRFEATDRQEDDAVLLQLMALIDRIVSGHCGKLLTKKAVAEIVETCLNMAKQMKRRDSLRRSVVVTLMSLVSTVFTNNDNNNRSAELVKAAHQTFSTLVQVLDPADLQQTNNIRITVLNILKLCFEVNGKAIGETESQNEVMQILWKYLAQLVRVTNSPRLVKEALQLVVTILNTTPRPYKSQFGFVLVYLLTSLTPLSDLPRDESTDDMFYAGVPNRAKCVKSAPVEPGSNILAIPTAAVQKTPEIREVMVEALAALAVSSPTLFSDLYITYDCDKASPDLCEDLLGFLCRNAYPDSATWSTASVPPLCLEAVLSGISAWVDVTDSSETKPLGTEVNNRLLSKSSKAVEAEVAEKFNKSPQKGITEMLKHGLVKSGNPQDIAYFLHSCKRLNKAVLGKFFAKSENKEILEYYVKTFDFSSLRIDEALRKLLCSFRLPGESAQIENLLQKFADHYIQSGEKVEKSSDSAFILAYAVLMLNTDHYSPTLKRRMDFEAFKRNVQGVDKDIPDDYVQAIFDGITSQEIIMPEEHDTDETFEHSWRELVLGQQSADSFYFYEHRSSEVIKAIFETNWRPIVSTLSFVFATATDDLVFRRVISGFHQLALLASRFKSQQALTHIIACLSQISALSSGDLSFPNSNIEIRIENHVSVIVSDLSTQFGGDLKAQMASITLFRILNVAAKDIDRSAYGLIAKALTNIHLYGLSTPSAIVNVKPLPPIHTFERSKAGKPVGIFSALSSYLTSSADTPAEPSDESVDAALGATECIKACKIDETVRKLIEGSAANFAEGALDVLPSRVTTTTATEAQVEEEKTKYRPAKDFLLRLAGRAAENLPELRKKICGIAADLSLIPTALLLAPPDVVPSILDTLNDVDDDILKVLLGLPPSPSLWRLVSLIERPNTASLDYILDHANAIDADSLDFILDCLKKAQTNVNEAKVIEVLKELAIAFRNKDRYVDVLAALGSLSGSSYGATRETALSDLQRELLFEYQDLHWSQAAEGVLIPHVLESLLKPEIWKRDPSGMDATRQQAASMVGKTFLHLTVSLNKPETEENVNAWVASLRMLDRLLSSRKQPALHESVVEMLKNVILVTKLASRGSEEFWQKTETELKGFLPEVAELVNKEAERDVKEVEVKDAEVKDAEKEAKDTE